MILTVAYMLATARFDSGPATARFDSGPGVLLNDIAFYPVILEGEVLTVEPRPPRYTFLILRARSYLHGSGPDTVRIELGWTTQTMVTHGENLRILRVPEVGDQGIFWIGRQASEWSRISALLSSDSQIWEIENDSLRALGMSLEDGRRLIREAATEASLAAQLPLATSVTVGHMVRVDKQSRLRPLQLVAEEVLKGSLLADTLSFAPTSKYARLWQQGLYLLTGPDSLGCFTPVHPYNSFFPTFDGKYVVGFRLVSREPVDWLMPVLADLDELPGIK